MEGKGLKLTRQQKKKALTTIFQALSEPQVTHTQLSALSITEPEHVFHFPW